MDPNWVWASGGLCAGCVIGICVSKLTGGARNNNNTKSNKKGAGSPSTEMFMMNFNPFNNTEVTTFSDITMLLGSPTSSALLDTQQQEYHMYSADKGYPVLDGNRTIMGRFLTPPVYEELYNLRTSAGSDIDTCIQPGIDSPDKISCGIVACDEECYELFSTIFDPVIRSRHRGFERGQQIRGAALSLQELSEKKFDPLYVKSTHFLVGRCVKGFRFPPTCRRAERRHVEGILQGSLEMLEGEFKGTYKHLVDIGPEERFQLPDILQSVIDPPESRTLVCSGATRDWPCGRGVFHSKSCDLFAWTNREDHLRIMLRDRGLDLVGAFKTFSKALQQIEEKLKENGLEYSFHEDYGYLLTCPSGIGTALRAGVHMKLPYLLQDERFRIILKNLRLHMGAEDQEMLQRGYVDVYNMDRLGFSEVYLVQRVSDAVHLLVQIEQRLESKQPITDLVTQAENFMTEITITKNIE